MKKMKYYRRNRTGGALVIALAAALVIMLSVMLLLGLVSRTVNEQLILEERTQARYTEESAISALCMDLRQGAVTDPSHIPSYTIGRLTTSFDLEDIETIPPRDVSLNIPGFTPHSVSSSGEHLCITGKLNDSLAILLIDGFTLEDLNGFPLAICPEPESWAVSVLSVNGLPEVMLAVEDSQTLYTISGEGNVTTISLPVSLVRSSSLAMAGYYGDEPAMIITNGSNRAVLLLPESGRTLFISSESGTCPVFLGEGDIFGTVSSSFNSFGSGFPVVDIMTGDLNRDGIEDTGWAGSSGLVFRSGINGTIERDQYGLGRLLAWGTIDGRFGFGGRWLRRDGSAVWRNLSYYGFQEYTAAGLLARNWEGRIESAEGSIIGSIDGVYTMSSIASGQSREFGGFTGASLIDIDRSVSDLVSVEQEMVRLLMNPLVGDGLRLTLTSRTEASEVTLTNTWWVDLFRSSRGIRVYAGREGTGGI